MAEETRDPEWGNNVARWTFFWTIFSAIGFAAAVGFFILRGGR